MATVFVSYCWHNANARPWFADDQYENVPKSFLPTGSLESILQTYQYISTSTTNWWTSTHGYLRHDVIQYSKTMPESDSCKTELYGGSENEDGWKSYLEIWNKDWEVRGKEQDFNSGCFLLSIFMLQKELSTQRNLLELTTINKRERFLLSLVASSVMNSYYWLLVQCNSL